MDTNSKKKDLKIVYTIVERSDGKSFWIRIGVGSTNRDGSLNLKLDAVPVNGQLQVREYEPRDDDPTHAPLGRPPRKAFPTNGLNETIA